MTISSSSGGITENMHVSEKGLSNMFYESKQDLPFLDAGHWLQTKAWCMKCSISLFPYL